MLQRALFYAGCVLAVLGLGLSLTLSPQLEVTGAFLSLAAIVCALALLYLNYVRGMAPLLPRSRPWLLPLSIALIVAALVNFFSFGRPAWHPYAQTLMMFLLAISTLLNGASYSRSSTA